MGFYLYLKTHGNVYSNYTFSSHAQVYNFSQAGNVYKMICKIHEQSWKFISQSYGNVVHPADAFAQIPSGYCIL